jgi:CDP-paratose 2-epimerase
MTQNSTKRVLVTGGAGFVGANLCTSLAARRPEWSIVAFDSLKRRGAELNLARLRAAGVEFVHGDVREPSDLEAVGEIDALVECSAEPSVLAGVDGGVDFVVHTNLLGAYNCLELARRRKADVVFLSTSRVYPVEPLESARWTEGDTRFELDDDQDLRGLSAAGVAEDFSLEGWRTLYGTTKLAAEHLIAEYAQAFGLRTVVDRCGVIAGPWQMGKVDQGVFTHWMLSHYLKRPLSYIGYGGKGKQVRDLIHVDDVVDLIEMQLADIDAWTGTTFNVGGGRESSLSLLETTSLCQELTGNEVPIGPAGEARPGDLRIYISDCERLYAHTDWRPKRGAREILADIFEWIRANEAAVAAALG